jgi:protein phosphatase 2C family protein 2/3
MEDAHTTILNLDEKSGKHLSFFAVYDGHGGSHAAKYAGTFVHQNLTSLSEFIDGSYRVALKSAFLLTDAKLREGLRLLLSKIRNMPESHQAAPQFLYW